MTNKPENNISLLPTGKKEEPFIKVDTEHLFAQILILLYILFVKHFLLCL